MRTIDCNLQSLRSLLVSFPYFGVPSPDCSLLNKPVFDAGIVIIVPSALQHADSFLSIEGNWPLLDSELCPTTNVFFNSLWVLELCVAKN